MVLEDEVAEAVKQGDWERVKLCTTNPRITTPALAADSTALVAKASHIKINRLGKSAKLAVNHESFIAAVAGLVALAKNHDFIPRERAGRIAVELLSEREETRCLARLAKNPDVPKEVATEAGVDLKTWRSVRAFHSHVSSHPARRKAHSG